MIAQKEKITRTLRKSVKQFNRWRRIYKIDKIDLTHIDLSYCNLRGYNLSRINFSYSDLSYCKLRYSNFSFSNLKNCNFSFSNLRGNNFSYSDFSGSNLSGSNFSFSNLLGCDLSYIDLSHCNLRGCNLRGSNLIGCDLDFSCLTLSCKILNAIFDQRQIVQILYHAAKPTENNFIELDEDVLELFNLDLFKKVVNKFHRVEEAGIYYGTKIGE